jgi:hypothetical protein
MSMPAVPPKLSAERARLLRFLLEAVERLGRLDGGAEEGGEGVVACEDLSSWAVTAAPFRFFDLVTLAPWSCAWD